MFSKNPFNMHRGNNEALNEDPAHYAAIARNNAAKQAERDKANPEAAKKREKDKANIAKAKPVYAKGDKNFASNIGVKEDTYVIPESIPANERTAFHGAAAGAAKAGKTSFSFSGKKYPVTMNKGIANNIADQKESIGQTAGDHGYYHLQKAKELAKKDGHDYDKLPQYDRGHDKHKDHYDSRAKKESVKKESTMTFREKLMSIFENDKASHYKSATKPETMDDQLKGAGAKQMKADLTGGDTKAADMEKQSHVDAAKAGRAGPGTKARSNDKKDGDKKAMSSATPIKDPTGRIQTMESKEHPHAEAMADHESQAREHKDNLSINPKTSGKHHKDAYHAHMDAADHLEYGRTKQAKASAEKAVSHAKKAKAAGGEDHVGETANILKKHHSAKTEAYINEKEHPHAEAMADHESQAREHSDNRHDNYKTSGKHHEAAKNAHNDAANHLEYGRTKQAKDSAEKALYHAKKAKAAGGEDHVGETANILKKHHSAKTEDYGISGNKISQSLLDAIASVGEK